MLSDKRSGVKRAAVDKLFAAHVGLGEAKPGGLAEEEEEVAVGVGPE